VVVAAAGGSGTLRSGAQETDLEEGSGSGCGEVSTGGARKISSKRDKVGAEKD